jgi:translocation and assembly module TamB
MAPSHAPSVGEDAPGSSPAPGASPPRRGGGRRALRVALAILALAAVLLAGALLLVNWALRSEGGSAWTLRQMPGVEVVNPRGTLLGDFAAESLVLRFGQGGALRLSEPAWQGLRVSRLRLGPVYAHVDIASLSAARGELTLPETDADPRTAPSRPPQDLLLPLTLHLGRLSLGQLDAAALGDEPLRDIDARSLRIGRDAHAVERLALARGAQRLQAQARIGATQPLQVDATVQLLQAAAPGWPAVTADARLEGPLERPTLNVQLSAAADVPQTLSVAAVLTPFAPFPLAQMRARARALDVSALVAGAPMTSLAGEATVLPAAGAAPTLLVQAEITNAAVGPWNEGRLPLRLLQLSAVVDPRSWMQLDLQSLQALLGSEEHPAGRIAVEGRSDGADWAVQALLDGVRPARLDARAPVMTLGGSIDAAGRGLAPPRAGTAPPQVGAAPPPSGAAAPLRRIDARADLQGTMPAGRGTRPFAARLDAGWSGQGGGDEIELRTLQARAGAARVIAQGTLSRADPATAWRADARGSVDAFDLQVWLPGAAGGTPSRLAGDAELALTVPAAGPGDDVLAWLATLQGQARATLRPSTLAGVALQGDARLSGEGAGLDLALRAMAAGNRIEADGRVARTPSADRWTARIDAPQLRRLAPLFALLDQANPADPPADQRREAERGRSLPPIAGRLDAELVASGRWPALSSRGQARASALRLPQLRLDRADAQWELGMVGNAPLNLQLDARELQLAGPEQVQRVRSLALRVAGSTQAHQIELQADIAARPPGWTDTLQPPPEEAGGARTLAHALAEGALQQRGGGPFTQAATGWQGRLRSVDLRRGGAGDALLRLEDVGISIRLADARQPLRLDVQAGSAEVVGAAVRWDALSYEAAHGNAPAAIDAAIWLDPLPVSPLLARLQPAQGWQGDLEIEGHARLQTAPVLRADVLLQRRRGDLSLMAGGARRAMGLRTLRLAVGAEGNAWSATADIDSAQVGTLQAAATARTAAGQTWPDADTAVAGTAQLRLAELDVWNPWLPVGWRVDGRLTADLRFDGTLAEPRLNGTVAGDALALSNFVEGIQLRDGELRAVLHEDTLRIERFVARGGDGTLRVEGSAQLGAQPTGTFVVQAERLRALARVDRRLDLSGRAELQLREASVALTGRFEVDEGLVDLGASQTPALSDDVIVVDDPVVEPAGAGLPALDLDLRIALGSALRVRGSGLNTLLSGDLRITAPDGTLAIDGTVRTVDGIYAAYGQTLDIERGVITFSGAATNPRLDVMAMRTDLDEVRVGVSITGTVQTPRVRLSSTPDMSDLDVLSWLTLGRPSADLAGDQTLLLQRAATALLASDRGAGGPTLAQRAGLDTLSIEGISADGLGGAALTIGKQLSERFYVGYRQSLAATGGSWELIYRITQRFTLRMLSGEATGIDAVWNWRWD